MIQGGKLTGRLLAKAIKKFLDARRAAKQKKQMPKMYHGKQTTKQLLRQNTGTTAIDVANSGIKDFERYARKYGVDYALHKDASDNPPKWVVLFKSRDADAMTAAFKEYSVATLGKGARKPSVMQLLRKMTELVKNRVVDRTKDKAHGGPER